jgi:PhzF family phenazine biosynthesis protein
MNRQIYKISAFQYNNMGGNPAGVVLDADLLSESDMLTIAKEVGYSETAFIMKSLNADFKVKFFTPVAEVDLCGHATIASFNLLRDLHLINKGHYTQETKAGVLQLEIHDNLVYMEQNIPIFSEIIDRKELINCFDVDANAFSSDMPIQIVSTGLRDIILPIRSLNTLNMLKANSNSISMISEKYDVVGIHAFCLESINKADAHTRNFAPRYGIDEESATGTSNGALACYLSKYSDDSNDRSFEFEQGYIMNLPSRIFVKLINDKGNIESVKVGGSIRIL